MLDFEDIQGYIISGYGHKLYSRFLFCEIVDVPKAQSWMRKVIPEVTTARQRQTGEPKPEVGVNLTLTAGGLRRLGLDRNCLGSFPREFSGGAEYHGEANPMATGPSSQLLGDYGDSAPQHWEFGGPNTPPVHLMLLLFSSTQEALEEMTERIGQPDSDNGLREVFRQDSNRLGGREAFGFHDGISQPGIAGSHIAAKPGQDLVKAGEFIMGYTNEYDMVSPPPTVDATDDPEGLLPEVTNSSSHHDLGRNGTYLSIRKLYQDVDSFWDFCAESTKNADGTPNDERKTWLASKMIGRWPSGAPMALTSDKDDPALGQDPNRNNDFLYSDDPKGLKCPMGSHLRRGNPRDDLPPDSPKKSVEVTKRHRIIRRGRPFNNGQGKEQGLMFMAINADIQRQFQFVQQTWINSPKFGHMYDNKDPILSDPELLDPIPGGSGKSVMTIPSEPVRLRVHGLKRFVMVKGGGYYFMPSMRALNFLASFKADTASDDNRASREAATASGGSSTEAAFDADTNETAGRSNRMSLLKNAWQDVLSVGGKLEDELHDDFLNLREKLDTRLEHLMGNPGLVRPLFKFLRHHEPIFATKKVGAVSLYDDTLEVLGNSECFSVVDIYAKKMRLTTGDFVLGMDDTERYQRWIGWMRQAVHPSDIDRIRQLGQDVAEKEVAATAPTGRIDFVGQLGRHIPTQVVGDYYGAPGPDEATNQGWMRAIFREIFLNLGNDPNFEKEAVNASKQLNAYLDGVVAQRKEQLAAGEEIPDDFLCRLVKLQTNDSELTDEIIRELVGGTIVGTTPTNNKATTQALEQLIERPDALAMAQEAARNDDDDLLTRYIFEAQRFNPQNPMLLRHCVKDCVVAAGTERETEFKAGCLVVVGTESAMLDERKFTNAEEFLVTRDLKDYILFGYGQHTCFGHLIATALWPAMLKPLLRRKNLARAHGDDGKIKYDGAFPDRWILTFDAD